MACSGRWAEAWQFAGFFCTGALISGVDDSGGAGNAFVTDSTKDFLRLGVEANVGMVLYNTTDNTNGPVTAVTTTTITATGITFDDGDEYRIVTIDGVEISTIEGYLNIAASDLHAAMAASDQCDCNLASWAQDYLEKLNIIDAAAYYQCKCGQPQMTDEMRGRYLDWMSEQLVAIRRGEIELCHGATGADWPAISWAEQTLTDFNRARIINNRFKRYGY